MRSAPGELTTAAGGGPEMLAVDAMWNAAGALVTATTEAPDRSPGGGQRLPTVSLRRRERAPTVMVPSADRGPGEDEGVMAAMPNAGVRITRVAWRRTASSAAPPRMCTQPS